MKYGKSLRLGCVDVGARRASVYVKVEINSEPLLEVNGVLGITAVVGPQPSGNALGGAGQCQSDLRGDVFRTYADGWDRGKVDALLAVWDRWHLNDMNAGSPAQQAYLAGLDGFADMDHRARKAALVEAGLDPDPGRVAGGVHYSYGSAWLREDLPEEVLEFLAALPESDKLCPWATMRSTPDMGPLEIPEPSLPTP